MQTWNVLQCNPGGSFCSRSLDDCSNCCDNSTTLGTFDIGKPKLTSTTVTVTESATYSAQLWPTGEQAQVECPKDNTIIVGGAVGGGLGAALIASIIVIVIMWKRLSVAQSKVQMGENQAHLGKSDDGAFPRTSR